MHMQLKSAVPASIMPYSRKLSRIDKNDHFAEKTRGMLKSKVGMAMACTNFVEKTFTGGSKTAKFVNVFSLESFPLYGMFIY